MNSVIQKMLKSPHRIFPHMAYQGRRLWRRLCDSDVRLVSIDGKEYYRFRYHYYPEYLNRGNAVEHIRDIALMYCRGKGIDVGSGRWPLAGSIPVENAPNQNAYLLDTFEDSSLDYVFSSHCLEHLDKWQAALCLWVAKLKPGGVLFLYLPHWTMRLWRPGAPWVGANHRWVPTSKAIVNFLSRLQMEIVEATDRPDAYWSFRIVARKLPHSVPAQGK